MNVVALRSNVLGILLFALSINVAEPAEPSGSPSQIIELSAPLDYQIFQRANRTSGTIRVLGKVRDPLAGETLEARLSGHGIDGDLKGEWQKIGSPQNGSDFAAELKSPAGGWFRLDLRFTRGDEVSAAITVPHVGVGELFVIAGQSNSANHGEKLQHAHSALVRTFSGTRWVPCNDPQPGASGNGGSFIPAFADAMADEFNVPVGVVATGVGATSVREWLPKGARFPNPPTLTGNVRQLDSGEWESNGALFEKFVRRLRSLGTNGFRAVLWHQGESDGNQPDRTRSLSAESYESYASLLIRESRRAAGWDFPWFVAQATYHTPDDPGSPEIRAAQAALWKSGMAVEGPDTDALTGALRDDNGRGVHFSDAGLREHGRAWARKVEPWLNKQFAAASKTSAQSAHFPPPKLVLPGEEFRVKGHRAFLFLPPEAIRQTPQPWIFYAPTLPGYPDEAERWMHEQFLAAGVAVAGIDVGEGYGSPKSRELFDSLYRDLTEKRGFARKLCVFGRSRGGLWVSSWAIANPNLIAGIIGIYPVFDFKTYPGLTNAAPAYGLSPAELGARAEELNPIERVNVLAQARIPVVLIHGDSDTVVPMQQNSAEFVRRYERAGAGSLVKLIVLPSQGHSFFEGFFHSQELVDFAIRHALEGASDR